MSESYEHRQLVEKSARWVIENLLDGESVYLTIDLDRSLNHDRLDPVLDNFRPDLYAYVPKSELLIIGESKTTDDIDREHSIQQYKSYYATCSLNRGDSFIVFSIPFSTKPRLKNVLRNANILSSEKIRIQILEF